MEIIATQDFESFFEDYVKEVISSDTAGLPPFKQRIGAATASWFECQPGVYHLSAKGGTIGDRALAQAVVQAQLDAQGFKRATYTFRWDRSDSELMKTSAWQDIEAKAKRLIESGKVHVLRNSGETIVGHVEGDHGNYESEIWRNDPNSQSISLWDCTCPWDQFAWQRTRQWKKLEGRPCAHVLALYWKSLATPLDEESSPGEGPTTPNAGMPGGAAPIVQGQPSFQPSMGPGQASPGSTAPMPPGVAAPPPELIPQFPGNPELQPQVNPVSVPGGKPQTPLNPVQNIGAPGVGGTFSKVADWDLDESYYHRAPTQERERIRAHGLHPSAPKDSPFWQEEHESLDPQIATQPKGVYLAPSVKDTMTGPGYEYTDVWKVDPSYLEEKQSDPLFPEADMVVVPHAIPPEALSLHIPYEHSEARKAKVANEEQFANGVMVVNKNTEWGTAVGLNPGESVEIPMNSQGEVLGQDPTTGMIEVYFAGPMKERGNLEPHGAVAFFFPSELTLRPDIRPPGPAIRRR
jgi:hypothetical protein